MTTDKNICSASMCSFRLHFNFDSIPHSTHFREQSLYESMTIFPCIKSVDKYRLHVPIYIVASVLSKLAAP